MKDHTGKRFGKLVAVSYLSKPSRWVCVCDCGREKTILTQSLVGGDSRSCGCGMGRPAVNHAGKRFGKLIALRRVRGPRSTWLCLCVCGVEKAIAACSLLSGNTVSCGCEMRRAEDPVRDAKALAEREAGATYVEIGIRHGTTQVAARKWVAAAIRRREDADREPAHPR